LITTDHEVEEQKVRPGEWIFGIAPRRQRTLSHLRSGPVSRRGALAECDPVHSTKAAWDGIVFRDRSRRGASGPSEYGV